MEKDRLKKIAEYVSPIASAKEKDMFKDGFIRGAKWLQSQPLADRLTEEERERIKTMYNQAVDDTKGYYSDTWDAAYAVIEFCEEIFGKEMFEK